MNEHFYHHPEMYYSPDKLVRSYDVPAPTTAFVYNAIGKKPLPTKDDILTDTVDSIAARFNLRYNEQRWMRQYNSWWMIHMHCSASCPATTIFNASRFNQLGGVRALAQFGERDEVFEALRQSTLVRQSLFTIRV
jgi:hypothetical protein